jgi:eukaryotic-like serine/threonine-protein kinase
MDPADRWQRIDELFYAALEVDPCARPAFLSQQCGTDQELLNEVESLLNSSDKSVQFARAAVSQVARQQSGELPNAGRRVGAYQLLRLLGEGGMGAVYLATRADEAYEQEVAIKLMHPGFGPSQGILLRFSGERQILANLNHSGIARLLDGGMTSAGVPYLVMEYVDGVRIDDYCRNHNSSIDDRLKLFRKVCAAVEYAHKHLVVHRDIKPGNILVTTDGEPKLLDFGIAKLLDTETGCQTTQTSERFMTPDYASPEQMCGNQITTATDVYALGVVLFELLTGRRPFQLHNKSPMEVAQIVCSEDPQAPSRVVAGDSNADDHAAARRLRGDLDNIVLMAMRKEPSLRYTSVAALSEDVQRYLTGHSVQARTGTWRYRGGKFVRRHKAAVAIAILGALALIGFSTGMGLLAHRATEQRRIADQQRLAAQREADFLAGIFDAATPESAKGSPVTSRELLDQSAKRIDKELAGAPDVQATLLYNLGDAYEQLGLNEQAQPLLERSYNLRRKLFGDRNLDVAEAADALAHAYQEEGNYAKADGLFRRSLQTAQASTGKNTQVVAKMFTDMGFCLWLESQDSEAESAFRRSLALNPNPDNSNGAITRTLLAQVLNRKGDLSGAWQMGNDAVQILERIEGPSFHLAIARHVLANLLRDRGNLLAAEHMERETLELWRKVGGSHVDVIYALNNLGLILLLEGNWREAQPLLRDALEARQEQLGGKHPLVAVSLLNYGRVLQAKGDYKGAETYLSRALDMLRETSGPEGWNVDDVLTTLALLHLDQRDYAGAESYATQALEMSRKLGGNEYPGVATSLVDVALAREFQGDAAGAVPLLRLALAIRRQLLGPSHPDAIAAQVRLGEALTENGNAAEAGPLLREALASAQSEPFPLLGWQIAEIEAVQGACLRELGNPAQAETLLSQSRAYLLNYPEAAIRRRELGPVEATQASDHSP